MRAPAKNACFTVFSLLGLALLACARSQPSPAALPVGASTYTVTYDGLERSYMVYVPASADLAQPLPLVLVFHGGTGNAQSARRMSGLDAVADQNGFIVVYPNGTGRLSDDKLLTWNGGTCCGYAQAENVDDVGFVRAVVADLQTRVTIDPHRIYATGLSNGAILSHRLACEAADLFAAVAPVAGTLNVAPCAPAGPVSVIEFHGMGDQHILYEGGFGPAALVNVDFASVADSVAFWVAANGCTATPQTDALADIEHTTWAGCKDATAVELYTIVDGGHAWPGGQGGWPGADEPTQSINASALIWEFFAAHPKP